MLKRVPTIKEWLRSGSRFTVTVSTLAYTAILLTSTNSMSSQQSMQFIQPSHEVKAAVYAQALESASGSQPAHSFLKLIGIPEAWAILGRNNVTSTIAIVDTGIDYNQPELKGYLLEGKNLINERKSAQDDNGHGTAVAGVIAAIAKAGEVSGQARWQGRLLPIKALDQDGSGDEDKLTQGIRYAVEQGADIIVLSLGLRRDAPNLREAVAWAESKGVLLIAASGNDAALFGSKAAVQYPAAYPTVLAVAGSDGMKPVSESTSGSENDISAAWRVQTLAMGGGMIEMEGTSMGAPQVAAAAAMLKAAHPDWKPVRLREAIRRTAQTNAAAAWSRNLGYGFLAVNRALQADSLIDWREPNDTRSQAAVFPLGKEVIGAWGSVVDYDWFTFDAPYDGDFTLSGDEARFNLFSDVGRIEPRENVKPQANILKQWQVKKGRYWLQSLSGGVASSKASGYRLVSQFVMSPDAREPNNSAASAFTLPARNQSWTGNFHQRSDEDWMSVTLPSAGILKLSVTTDTTRIDPELWVQSAGGASTIVDKRGDGESEQWVINHAKAGKYFLRIQNAVSTNPEAVIGTYVASMEYITEKEDAYEPNEGPLTSTPLSPDKVYNGLINNNKDQDWYRFTFTKRQKVKLTIGHIPDAMTMTVELRNKKLQIIEKWSNTDGQKTLIKEKTLLPGTYYVTITSNRFNRNQTYGLRMLPING
jgi:hypothetical protein